MDFPKDICERNFWKIAPKQIFELYCLTGMESVVLFRVRMHIEELPSLVGSVRRRFAR